MGRIFDGKQHRLGVQTRPGGSILLVHKEMTVSADGCLGITGTCVWTRQAQRENSTLGSRSRVPSGVTVRRMSFPVAGQVETTRATRPVSMGANRVSSAHPAPATV